MRRLIALTLLACFTVTVTTEGKAFASHFGGPSAGGSAGAPAGKILESFHSDLATGRAIFGIPLAVPPGRRGVQPAIGLSYSSAAKNGPVGVGWALELGAIERSTRFGPPKFDSTDTFTVQAGGATGDLVQVAPGEYRPKDEQAFARILFNGTSWTVTSKDGATVTFGGTPDSVKTTSRGVVSWLASQVQDIHGNTMTISYQVDGRRPYPASILYTAHPATGLAAAREVRFTWEPRPDVEWDERFGDRIEMNLRLQKVECFHQNALVRRYTLSYVQNSLTSRSVLASVTTTGSDGAASLPPVRMTYSDAYAGRNVSTAWNDPDNSAQGGTLFYFIRGQNGGQDTGYRFEDVNGDGLPDLIDGSAQLRVWINANYGWSYGRTNAWSRKTLWDPPFSFVDEYGRDNGARFVDLNGDGRTDLYYGASFHGIGEVGYLNTGAGWQKTYTWNVLGHTADGSEITIRTIDGERRDTGMRFVELNGDGKTDLLQGHFDSGKLRAWINTGSGWREDPRWAPPLRFIRPSPYAPGPPYSADQIYDNGCRFVDLNGDGLTDLLYAGDDEHAVYLNTGAGWKRDTSWSTGLFAGYVFTRSADNEDQGWRLFDVNGDGLPDLLRALTEQPFRALLNTGAGWREDSRFLPPTPFTLGGGKDNGARFADLNGDGSTDLFYANSNSPQDTKAHCWASALSTPPPGETPAAATPPDLLTRVENGVGGTTTLTYTPSTAYDNRGGDLVEDLPFATQTVATQTLDNGLGWAATTRFSYSGAKFNAAEREFLGFEYAKATDPQNSTAESWFHQDVHLKGRPYKQEARDGSGNLYSRTENAWACTDLVPGTPVHFCHLASTTSTVFDGDATSRQTKASYTYDSYGNVTQQVAEGDTGVTGDERTTITEYTRNETLWLMAHPSHVIVADDAAGAMISESWVFYDGSSAYTTPPTRGLPTKTEAWLSTGPTNPVATATYDAYGNKLTSTDPLGRITTTAYDPAEQFFPVTVTNALGHTLKTTYDPGTGLILSTTDPNGQVTQNRYDALGRLTAVVGPEDTDTAPGVRYEYDLSTLPTRATKRVKAATGGSTGGSAGDSSGSTPPKTGYHLTDHNGVSQAAGKVASAAQFTAADSEYLSTADNPDMGLGSDTSFTWALWVYPNSIDMQQILYKADANAGTVSFEYVLTLQADSTWRARLANGRGQDVDLAGDTGTPIRTGTWYFLVFSHDADANTVKLRVNDATESSASYSSGTQDTAHPVRIGARNNPTDQFWNGKIDEAGFWKKALSAQEITDLYNNGQGNTFDTQTRSFLRDSLGTLTQQLIAYYKMEEASGTRYDATEYAGSSTPPSPPAPALDTTAYYTSHSFADGLGRVIQTRSPAQDPAQQIISGCTELGTRGETVAQFLPHFQPVSASYQPPTAGTPKVLYDYDAMGRLIRITDPDGAVTSTAYSDWTVTATDARGNTTVKESDAYGRLVKVIEPVTADHPAAATSYAYDPAGRLAQVTDSKGSVTKISYDSLGRKTSMDDPDMGHWTYAYDAAGNLTKQTDAKGQVLEFSYDALNRLTQKIGRAAPAAPSDPPPSGKTGYHLTDHNTVTQATGKVGNAALFTAANSEYLSRADSASLSLGSDTSFSWAMWVYINTIAENAIIYKGDATVGTISFEYVLRLQADSTWRAHVSNGTANSDIHGDTGTAISTATWYFLTLIHDADADTFTLRVNDSTQIQNAYTDGTQDGPNPLQIGARNVSGTADQFFDGRIDEVGFWKKALSAQEQTDLYNAGQGNTFDKSTRAFTYDPQKTLTNQLVAYYKMEEPSGTRYDATEYTGSSSSSSSSTSPATVLAAYAYDAALDSAGSPKPNGVGRLSKVTDPSGSTEFFYDLLGREIKTIKTIAGSPFTVQREYDPLNRLTRLLYPNGTDARYTYSPQGITRIHAVNADSSTSDFLSYASYNPAGETLRLELGNGAATDYTYDPNTLRIAGIRTANSLNQTLQDFSYSFDNNGNLTALTDRANSASQTFQYDALNRLASASGGYGPFSFRYDPTGNLLQKDNGMTLSYGRADRSAPHAATFCSTPANGASPADSHTLSYDPCGCLAAKGSTTYAYDLEHRLTEVAKDGSTTRMAYDGDGGRVQLTTPSGTTTFIGQLYELAPGGTTRAHIFFGPTRLATLERTPVLTARAHGGQTSDPHGGQTSDLREHQLASKRGLTPSGFRSSLSRAFASLDSSLTRSTPRRLRRAFAAVEDFFVGKSYADVTLPAGTDLRFYHPDHLGSVNLLTDHTGAQLRLQEFSPFGKPTRGEGTVDTPHKFTAKRFDDSTGLYYYGARYYDPELGRFIQPDTIVQAPSDPQTLNRYTYVRNNPLIYTDPTGHFFWFAAVFAAISAAITAAAIPAAVAIGIKVAAVAAVAVATYTFASGIQQGQSAGTALGRAAMAGLGTFAAGYIGGAIGGTFGTFWAGVGAGIGAGAAGGASSAAALGGDPLLGAAAGAAAGAIGGLFSGIGGNLGTLGNIARAGAVGAAAGAASGAISGDPAMGALIGGSTAAAHAIFRAIASKSIQEGIDGGRAVASSSGAGGATADRAIAQSVLESEADLDGLASELQTFRKWTNQQLRAKVWREVAAAAGRVAENYPTTETVLVEVGIDRTSLEVVNAGAVPPGNLWDFDTTVVFSVPTQGKQPVSFDEAMKQRIPQLRRK